LRAVLVQTASVIRVRNPIVVAGAVAALVSSALAEPPITLDCTIGYWNSRWVKEMEHDYQKGYSATKVAPKDMVWLRLGKIGHSGRGFLVLGRCQKGNVTRSTDLRKLTIKLSKLASDHGRTPLTMRSPVRSYVSSSSEYQTQLLMPSNAVIKQG
jgi:hypothetical protein